MKQILFLVFLVITFCSCDHIRGSGKMMTENRKTGVFTGISAGENIEVEVKIGPLTEVIVESDDNIIRYIETDVRNGDLKIRLENGHSFSGAHIKVFITTPDLTMIRASSSAEIRVNETITSKEKISFYASSSGEITADVNAPQVQADASSSATIRLSGRTMIYTAEASSSADILSWGLLSEKAIVKASSSATIKTHASVNLKARASSSGSIIYHGACNVEKTISSGGAVTKKG